MVTPTTSARGRPGHFEHEALIYRGHDEFLAGTLPFLRDGLDAGDPMLVAVPRARMRALQAALGTAAREITFLDMVQVGRNPARIIPLWEDFLTQAGPGTPRGIGEPVWAGRQATELAECERHEALLNVAFLDAPPWRLLCPYDAAALPPAAIEAAERTHPLLTCGGVRTDSATWPGVEAAAAPDTRLLGPVPAGAATLAFDGPALRGVRRLVLEVASSAGLSSEQAADLALATHEVAANSVEHGGGTGELQAWVDDGTAVVEVRDAGEIRDALVGRRRPDGRRVGGRGLWMAQQLCDLVQVRRTPTGTTVRLHQRRS